jgi:penicillin G amidase
VDNAPLLPAYEGELAVSGLEGDVTVFRDHYGVPQIYADSAEDLFTAQGYVHAQDRFWEMDFRRHVTSGPDRARHVPSYARLAPRC